MGTTNIIVLDNRYWGVGTTPHFYQKVYKDLLKKPGTCLHSSEYLHSTAPLKLSGNVVLIGSGQSAAEIF